MMKRSDQAIAFRRRPARMRPIDGPGITAKVLESAHWPSDTIAVFLLGVLYLALSITALRFAERGTAAGA